MKWLSLIGVSLIIGGMIMIGSFVKPYLYFALGPVPLEASHRLKTLEGRIFVPSIKLSAPLVGDMRRLDNAIVINADTAVPGVNGNTVMTGHNYAKGSPLFSLLHLVNSNDQIILHYRGKRYVYRVRKRTIVKPEAITRFSEPTEEERLTLITCYPPTSNAMRLIVVATPKRDR